MSATITHLSQKVAFVQRLPLFSNISPTDCDVILSSARERSLRRREVIFYQGDPVQQVVVLLAGSVKITQLGYGGGEVILRICGAGDIVSGFQLPAHSSHVSTAQAVQPCTSLVWKPATFLTLVERFPAFRCNTVHALELRLRELEQRFREVSTERVCSRLSSELIRLSHRLGRGANGTPKISLSRVELAQMTGTSLFTVSRLLCQWQKLGIVRIGREAVHVRDLHALTQISQTAPEAEAHTRDNGTERISLPPWTERVKPPIGSEKRFVAAPQESETASPPLMPTNWGSSTTSY